MLYSFRLYYFQFKEVKILWGPGAGGQMWGPGPDNPNTWDLLVYLTRSKPAVNKVLIIIILFSSFCSSSFFLFFLLHQVPFWIFRPATPPLSALTWLFCLTLTCSISFEFFVCAQMQLASGKLLIHVFRTNAFLAFPFFWVGGSLCLIFTFAFNCRTAFAKCIAPSNKGGERPPKTFSMYKNFNIMYSNIRHYIETKHLFIKSWSKTLFKIWKEDRFEANFKILNCEKWIKYASLCASVDTRLLYLSQGSFKYLSFK